MAGEQSLPTDGYALVPRTYLETALQSLSAKTFSVWFVLALYSFDEEERTEPTIVLRLDLSSIIHELDGGLSRDEVINAIQELLDRRIIKCIIACDIPHFEMNPIEEWKEVSK
jgi:hypothetical protein